MLTAAAWIANVLGAEEDLSSKKLQVVEGQARAREASLGHYLHRAPNQESVQVCFSFTRELVAYARILGTTTERKFW